MIVVDRSALQELCDNASPAPWTAQLGLDDDGVNVSYKVIGPSETTIDVGYEEDAAFIAAARSAIPELLAETVGLREDIDALESKCAAKDEEIARLREEVANLRYDLEGKHAQMKRSERTTRSWQEM